MAIVKKISELTPKGSNLGNTDLLIVGVDNGTDYDLKSVTGAQLLGTVVSQTITNGVTTKSPSEDVIYDNLALKVDKVAGSRLITSAESTILGNTSGSNTGDQDLSSYATNSTVVKLTGNQSIAGIKTFDNIKLSSNTFITPTHMIGFDANFNVSTVDSANARTVLGLGSLATQSGTFSGTSSGTNTGDETVTTIKTKLGITTLSGSNTGDQDLSTLMVKSNNLSDLTNTTTARTNLGLGSLATQSGTFSGTSSGTNTGDQIISDATITTTDITTNNFTTAKHGFVPKGTNVGNFLKDDGTWGTPASGSSGGIVGIANSSGVYTYYATLTLAMTAAVSGQTVELFSDINETGSVAITLKNGVNINGNGHTYTLSVNDATNAFNGSSITMEFYNIKVNRTGRTVGTVSGFALNDSSSTIRCFGAFFNNLFGISCKISDTNIYNINSISYFDGLADYGASKIYNSNGESIGVGYGISTAGTVYNSIGKSISNRGIYSSGEVYQSIGISTSGIGGEGIFFESTLISSSNNGAVGTLYNSYVQSTSSPTTSNSSIYNSTIRCLWNNTGGHCTSSNSVVARDILNSFLEVTNASAYCINGAAGSTWKYSNNSFKGSTVAVNSTNITQGITNISDTKGNILI